MTLIPQSSHSKAQVRITSTTSEAVTSALLPRGSLTSHDSSPHWPHSQPLAVPTCFQSLQPGHFWNAGCGLLCLVSFLRNVFKLVCIMHSPLRGLIVGHCAAYLVYPVVFFLRTNEVFPEPLVESSYRLTH